MTDSPEEILLRGVVRVENVENPAQYIPAVLARCRRRHLERTYDVRGWAADAEWDGDGGDGERDENIVGKPDSDRRRRGEAIRFLEALARKGGRLLKGGEADLDAVAKMVLNDFLRGKIPWFCPPPASALEGDGVGEGGDAPPEVVLGKRKRADGSGIQVEGDGEGELVAEEDVEADESEFGSLGDENDAEVSSEDESEGESDVKDGGVEISTNGNVTKTDS